VADESQHHGIGYKLMTLLMDAARTKGLAIMEGDVLAENHAMLNLVASLGFTVEASAGDATVRAVTKAL
jgi:acetyltransferase